MKKFLTVLLTVLIAFTTITFNVAAEPEEATNEVEVEKTVEEENLEEVKEEAAINEAVELETNELTAEANGYTVTLDYGIEGFTDVVVNTSTGYFGRRTDRTQKEYVRTPDEKEKTGYEFVCWKLNDTKVEFNKSVYKNNTTRYSDHDDCFVVTDNIKLTAEWNKVPTVTYDYDAEGIENKTVVNKKTGFVGERYNRVEMSFIEEPTDIPSREGYDFVGWTCEDKEVKFDVDIYRNNDTKTRSYYECYAYPLNTSITLKAVWAKTNVYKRVTTFEEGKTYIIVADYEESSLALTKNNDDNYLTNTRVTIDTNKDKKYNYVNVDKDNESKLEFVAVKNTDGTYKLRLKSNNNLYLNYYSAEVLFSTVDKAYLSDTGVNLTLDGGELKAHLNLWYSGRNGWIFNDGTWIFDGATTSVYEKVEDAVTWKYELTNVNEITATCSDVEVKPVSFSILPTATSFIYGDVPTNGYAKLNNAEEFSKATGKTLTIVYSTSDKEAPTATTEVGKYYASVTVEGVTATVDFDINQKPVSAPSIKGTLTYNGDEQAPTLDEKYDKSYMTLIEDVSLDSTWKQTNAGEYKGLISLDKNHKWDDTVKDIDGKGCAILTWTIDPMIIEVSASDEEYTGGPVKLNLTFKDPVDALVKDSDYLVEYKNLKEAPTNVGNYTAVITLKNPNYVFADDKTIAEVNFNITEGVYDYNEDILPLVKSLEYNGHSQHPIDTDKLPNGVIYAPAKILTRIAGYNNSATDADKYQALIRLDDDNYKWSKDTIDNHSIYVPILGRYVVIDWSIAKKDATVTVSKETVVYGEPTPHFTLTGDGFVDDEFKTIKYYISIPRYIGKDAGTYDVVPTYTSKYVIRNYNITTNNGQLVITKAPLTFSLKETNKVYDGTPFTPEVLIDGLKYNDKLVEGFDSDYTVVYLDKELDDALKLINISTKNVGDKVAVVKLWDTDTTKNYYLVNGDKVNNTRLYYYISPKHINVTWDKELVYNGYDQAPKFVVEDGGIIEGDDFTINTLVFRSKHADVGKYMIQPFPVGEDAENYLIDLPTATPWFEITPYELHLIWSPKTKFSRHSYKQAPYIADVEFMQGEDTYGMQGIDDNILDQDVWVMYEEGFGPQLHTGKYTAKVELLGPKAKNYTIKEGDEQIAFKIYRKSNEDTTPVKTGVDR